jgi:succinate dehydrogenase/fumarate reductase flavoprotein subunit
MTASLVGALEGLDTLLCEKSDLIGGTTAMSAGTIWMPGNRQSVREGVLDDAQAAAGYLEAEIGPAGKSELRAVYLRSGPHVLDYLEKHTDVFFRLGASSPDYHSQQPGATLRGRALVTPSFDGRLLGKDLASIRPPRRESMMLGGMMIGRDDIGPLLRPFASFASFSHAFRLVLRYAVDRLRYPRGTRLLQGNALVARLLHSLRKAGAKVETDASLVRLVRQKGRITGAIVRVGGKHSAIEARRAVVLATGGASRNAALSPGSAWREKVAYSLLPESNTGDGMKSASTAGGSIDTAHVSPVFWMPVSVLRETDGSKSIFPHIAFDRAKPGLIAVNAAGLRFVNEADSYHDFVLGMLRSHESVPSIPAHLVCDHSFIRDYGIGLIWPGGRHLKRFVDAGYAIVAPSIGELAGKIGVDADGLAMTVSRHNEFARTGIDLDFGKGTNALNLYNGDPGSKPNPCLRAISVAPFYAVAVHPADFAASVGLRTDENARVLNSQGLPIEGLYACGGDMSSIMCGEYPGPGTALGPGLVFGWRAAMFAAGRINSGDLL